jgi:predicted XRE-type DNA-binding protein
MSEIDTSIRRGNRNVFADLGNAGADSHLLKASLVSRVQDVIDRRGLTQGEAGKILGIGQPDVSGCFEATFAMSRSRGSCASCARSATR